jgi:RNA polymerase sigma-70 factor (ECF subfamily)
MERTPDRIYDEWLVLRSQDGERDAFAELVGRWNGRLVAFAVGLTGREDTAQDAVQSAWLVAAREVGRLNDPARFPEWICRIVRNKCVDAVRRAQRTRRLERGSGKEISKEASNPSAAASDLEETSRLRSAIAGLAPAQREILGLHYGASLGLASIAEILGVPVGTAKSRLHAARNELRIFLERNPQ